MMNDHQKRLTPLIAEFELYQLDIEHIDKIKALVTANPEIFGFQHLPPLHQAEYAIRYLIEKKEKIK